MRGLVFAALLGACSSDSATDVIDCDKQAWSMSGTIRDDCERACAAGPEAQTDDLSPDTTCIADVLDEIDPATGMPKRRACAKAYVANYEGERGCCIPSFPPDRPVRFASCGAQ